MLIPIYHRSIAKKVTKWFGIVFAKEKVINKKLAKNNEVGKVNWLDNLSIAILISIKMIKDIFW